jgi:hypothetical protein
MAADAAGRLQDVLRDLPRTVATQQRDIEVSVVPVEEPKLACSISMHTHRQSHAIRASARRYSLWRDCRASVASL